MTSAVLEQARSIVTDNSTPPLHLARPLGEVPATCARVIVFWTQAGRYGGAVDVKRAADLYAQGWSLRQIGAELGVVENVLGLIEDVRVQVSQLARRTDPVANATVAVLSKMG
jgi:hypothetical protein